MSGLHITSCPHGLDLRVHPRCYLCKPATPEAPALPHEHRWQPGPFLAGRQPTSLYDDGMASSLLLVCECGIVARVPVPWQIEAVPR